MVVLIAECSLVATNLGDLLFAGVDYQRRGIVSFLEVDRLELMLRGQHLVVPERPLLRFTLLLLGLALSHSLQCRNELALALQGLPVLLNLSFKQCPLFEHDLHIVIVVV